MKFIPKFQRGMLCPVIAFSLFFPALAAAQNNCPPYIECLQGVVVQVDPSLGNNDLAVIHGAQLIDSVSSACSNLLTFSVYRSDEVVSGAVVPSPNDGSVTLNCAQDCQGTVVLRLYVWDDNFNPDAVQPDGTVGGPNYAFCETYVLIQDMPLFCNCDEGDLITISGHIRTETGHGINNVEVSLYGDASASATTDTSGYYAFNDLAPGGHYVIAPEKDNFPQNGVTVADVILISKHILGFQHVGSPYRMIAADVNNDRKITTIDLVHMRRLILGLDTEFVANTSWRFAWAGYDFPIPLNPWAEVFPETGDFDFEEDTVIDFIGIKIGDVNNSANPGLH